MSYAATELSNRIMRIPPRLKRLALSLQCSKTPRWLCERVPYYCKTKQWHGIVIHDPLRGEVWTMPFGLHLIAVAIIRSYLFLRLVGVVVVGARK